QDRSDSPSGLATSTSRHSGTHGSGTGGEAEPYETGAESGNYEGEGFNRGYGVATGPRQDRSDGYRHARHGEFGDVQDHEDLYGEGHPRTSEDRKSTRLNSSHVKSSYAVFCLKKKKNQYTCDN